MTTVGKPKIDEQSEQHDHRFTWVKRTRVSKPQIDERPAATIRGQPSSGRSHRKYVVGGACGSIFETVGHWALELWMEAYRAASRAALDSCCW